MDYLSEQVEEAKFAQDTVLRRAMRKHLGKVAAALHAIEWNDSGDGAPDEDELIRACLQPSDELAQAKEDAEKAKADLEKAIATAGSLFAIWGYRQDKTARFEGPETTTRQHEPITRVHPGHAARQFRACDSGKRTATDGD